MRVAVLLVFVLITFSLHAQYPRINDARPRIYADAGRLAWCRGNHATPGLFKEDYDDFIYRYDNYWINDPELYMVGEDPAVWTWTWNSQWAQQEFFFTVFIYKITGDALALKRCNFLAQQVITAVNEADFPSMGWDEKETFLRRVSECGGILLDWCHDDLPSGVRDALTQAMYVQSAEFMDFFILSSSGTSYVSSHNTWNNIICNQNALVLYNAPGLSPGQQDMVESWFHTIYDKLTNGFIPCWSYYRDDDGGWNWGAAYALWSLVDQFQLFENMRIGTDKNFYNDLPWIRNSINQYIYFLQPDDKCIHLGDGVMKPGGADRAMYLHARYYDDVRSKSLVQYWSRPENISWTPAVFDKLLYCDYSVETVPPSDMPLDWWADKVGLSVSRSSWETDATMVTFFNSPGKRAAHEHRDNNSFMIFKNSPLLIHSGHYDSYASPHYLNYYQRTIAHNSICVYDPTETYYSFGQAVSNDGGQIESYALQNYNDIFDPANQRGEWIKYAAGADYTYQVADAQLSYDPDKLDLFRRRLLYVKPDQVIVLDHVHLNNIATDQRDISWVAHFASRPGISGDIVHTAVEDHIVTYDGKDYTVVNVKGNLAIRTLLPAGSNTTLTGGEGYEYWVDGTNYAPDPAPDTSFYTPGSWRIEVRPDDIPDDGHVVYLHTIDIGDDKSSSSPGGSALRSPVSVGADWNGTLYFFAADGQEGKDYHLLDEVSGARTVSIFAADLLPGSYVIKMDGTVTSAQLNMDENGILQGSVDLPPGSHTIEIAPPGLNTGPAGKALLEVYPNPVLKELHVKGVEHHDKPVIEIYNVFGRLVARYDQQGKIDVSCLAGGMYVLKVRSDNKIRSAKFIKG